MRFIKVLILTFFYDDSFGRDRTKGDKGQWGLTASKWPSNKVRLYRRNGGTRIYQMSDSGFGETRQMTFPRQRLKVKVTFIDGNYLYLFGRVYF